MMPTYLNWLFMGLLGAIGASFVNVVIYRLPLILERLWAASTSNAANNNQEPATTKQLSLSWPASHCPSCKQALRWWHNIPLFSWLFLRGQCAFCSVKIPTRYFLVELMGCLAGVLLYWRFGFALESLVFLIVILSWLALAGIDARTKLLPDCITLPLVWAGLIWHWWFSSSVMFDQAFIGAITGYLSLWSIYWLFKLFTGREGMGYGDFKLLAGIGAWLGAPALVPVVLLASFSGLIVALILKMRGAWQGQSLPFGPYLICGAVLMLLFGHTLGTWLGFGAWLDITNWALPLRSY